MTAQDSKLGDTDDKIFVGKGDEQAWLALALAKRPDVLVLDEPAAALDPLARREFLNSLMEAVTETSRVAGLVTPGPSLSLPVAAAANASSTQTSAVRFWLSATSIPVYPATTARRGSSGSKIRRLPRSSRPS